MIAYVDSSVLLRKVLRQPGSLKEWRGIQTKDASSKLVGLYAATPVHEV